MTANDILRLSPSAQKQVMDKLRSGHMKKESKYHNEPVEERGIMFASKKEALRYRELMLLLRTGKIRKLKLQADYTLQEAYTTENGERIRAIRYRADFAYERATKPDVTGTVHWIPVVEDVKTAGTATEKYKIKKKMLMEKYGIPIVEV